MTTEEFYRSGRISASSPESKSAESIRTLAASQYCFLGIRSPILMHQMAVRAATTRHVGAIQPRYQASDRPAVAFRQRLESGKYLNSDCHQKPRVAPTGSDKRLFWARISLTSTSSEARFSVPGDLSQGDASLNRPGVVRWYCCDILPAGRIALLSTRYHPARTSVAVLGCCLIRLLLPLLTTRISATLDRFGLQQTII